MQRDAHRRAALCFYTHFIAVNFDDITTCERTFHISDQREVTLWTYRTEISVSPLV